MATKDNLAAAFAGESQANRKYLAYAKKAEDDGYPQVAKLFRAAAAAETVHAHAHFDVMGGVQDTAANLQDAIEGEGHEFTEMYPDFLHEAEEEGNDPAVLSFGRAMAVEKIHHNLYQDALKAVESGNDIKSEKVYVCSVCGNTVYGDPPDVCPVCGAKKEAFFEVE
ncbi:MAG: rubrerythrin family protein [Candidatus Eisenbacteria bacterium]|nr:rubrerythrin family protein [Candidatus Eisenbacteria bacterium]